MDKATKKPQTRAPGKHWRKGPTAHKSMPYRCRRNGCRKFFSVKVGTVMQDSELGYQEWAIAV